MTDGNFSTSRSISCHSAKPQNLLWSEHGVILTPEGRHEAAPFHNACGGVAACCVRAAPAGWRGSDFWALRQLLGPQNPWKPCGPVCANSVMSRAGTLL